MNDSDKQIESELAPPDKVSVIIPTFNRQHTLLRAIKSVLQQTYPIHEILVCDDGSNDNSKKLVCDLNNATIKWLDCGKNGMPSIPRNKGIRAASGKWIAFLDSDDEWLPNKTAAQINFLKKTNSKAVSCNAFRIAEQKNKGPYLSYKNDIITFQDLLSSNYNICSSVMLSKKLLEETSLFPEEKAYKAIEDYALWLRITTKANFVYLKEPLLKYYDNSKLSIRVNTDISELKTTVFMGFLEWIKKHEIPLQPRDEMKLTFTANEIFEKRKISLWKRVKKKYRIKIPDLGK